MPGLGDFQEDAIRSLEAEILLRTGDQQGALTVLRTITYEVPHGATYHAVADGSRSRFLRAELELARGDTTVAKGLRRKEGGSPTATPLSGPPSPGFPRCFRSGSG